MFQWWYIEEKNEVEILYVALDQQLNILNIFFQYSIYYTGNASNFNKIEGKYNFQAFIVLSGRREDQLL